MEIIKSELNPGIYKLSIGAEYNTKLKEVTGSVELDIESQRHFVEMINAIFESPCVKVIVDMTHISYIDSSGLWALFEGHKKASEKEGNFVLLSPNKDVRRVLDITKMSSKVLIYDSLENALEAFEVLV